MTARDKDLFVNAGLVAALVLMIVLLGVLIELWPRCCR